MGGKAFFCFIVSGLLQTQRKQGYTHTHTDTDTHTSNDKKSNLLFSVIVDRETKSLHGAIQLRGRRRIRKRRMRVGG